MNAQQRYLCKCFLQWIDFRFRKYEKLVALFKDQQRQKVDKKRDTYRQMILIQWRESSERKLPSVQEVVTHFI
mgnify:CR=1 FL=1